MKLDNFNLGVKLEKKQLEKSVWGGITRSNGHTTNSAGDDCDTTTSDSDTGIPNEEVSD